MATEGQQEDTKSRIQALLNVKKFRGLEGTAAIQAWAVASLECLLEAELARIEKRERDAT